MALNVVIGSVLYLAAGLLDVEVESEQAKMLYQIMALIAALLGQFLTSMVSQKASKVAKIYTPKGNR